MARKRKQTEQAPVTLEELPRDTKELTPEEAEAAKGGFVPIVHPMKQIIEAQKEADAIYTWDEVVKNNKL